MIPQYVLPEVCLAGGYLGMGAGTSVVFRSDEDHRYRYSRWDGTEWIHSEICKAGSWFPQTPPGEIETEPYYSGGIILDHQNPSHVYLSRCVEGIFEIERWETPDSGRTWRNEAITRNSSRHNVRPFVSRGHPGRNGLLLWMHGSYIHWTNYDTQIRMVHLPAGNIQNISLPICGREGMI